jgi:hypothetical protein
MQAAIKTPVQLRVDAHIDEPEQRGKNDAQQHGQQHTELVDQRQAHVS